MTFSTEQALHANGRELPTVETAEAVRTTIDNCEDEPIRIPGSIQRHGFLLVLDAANEYVVAASENTEDFLEVPLRLTLGTPVQTVLEREILSVLRGLDVSSEAEGQMTYLGSFPLRKELYSVVTHRVGTERVLEFERLDRLVNPELMNAVITNFLGRLSKLSGQSELCWAITAQVKELTGFNRVLLYSFDDVGHGTVLAEENDGVLPSYLDLRFPSSDIPKQARELYIANTVRIIPDANYTASPLRGAANRPMRSFDLSAAALRSVSPIHLEYMRNMGTLASMSISIVFEGRLWGLISCHHAVPRTVPYVVRSACDLLTKMVGTQLLAFQSSTGLERALHFHGVQRRLLTEIAAESDYIATLIAQIGDLPEVTGAEGAALVLDGQCYLGGRTPAPDDVLRLAEWLGATPEMEVFSSQHLHRELDWTDRIRDTASGLLAARISDVRQSYLLWFRPEVISTVKWAGEPVKMHNQVTGLHPRDSFNIWQQEVHSQSLPWTAMEVESAEEFRTALLTITLRRAEEAVEVSEARFEQLTHALPNLIFSVDDEGNLRYVNQRWREEGLSAEGIWWQQARLSSEDRERCSTLWNDAVQTGSGFETEFHLLGINGKQEHWTLAQALPFLRSNQSRAGWVGTLTDLTERRERETALKMTEKLALTGRMTSVIAHEINNPLEAIGNIHFLLAHEIRGMENAENYLSMAEHEVARISGITKQTLRWSKENSLTHEPSTAGLVFDDVLRLFAGKIRNRSVTVTVEGRDTPFFGILGQIRQVVANLVANAADAVPVGGRIWLSASIGEDGGTEIRVGDAGPGMSPEVLAHLFQPFYSTKGDLGNGLGLYISQEIMQRHGGALLVDSTPGEGTIMTARLPAAGMGV